MHAEKSLLREYLEALLIAVIFATFARTWVLQAFKIPSGSMEQNLLVGDHILVNKFVYGPTATALEEKLLPVRKVDHGDVVVFKFPEDPTRDFIKRCVGLPGDRVEIRERILHLNGKPVDEESYTYYSSDEVLNGAYAGGFNPKVERYGPFDVPAGEYFCMGDHRDNSNDSRFWGTVPEGFVKGRAFVVYWSFDNQEGELGSWPGFWGKLRQVSQVALNFFTRTRWERTFRVVR
jgi:signal peptidase I